MAADPAAVAAAAARALEAHQLRLEKHFGFRIDRLKADDEHGDYARWRAAILHHVRQMPGALEALMDAATVTAVAPAPAMGAVPVFNPAQFMQVTLRKFIVGSLAPESNAEKLVRALSHASGLAAVNGAPQVWQVLEQRYYVDPGTPSTSDIQKQIEGLKWPKTVSSAAYKERFSKLRGFADQLGDFPTDDADASQRARARLWRFLADPMEQNAAHWQDAIDKARNFTNNAMADGVGTWAQLMTFVSKVQEAADLQRPAPRALAAVITDALEQAAPADANVVDRLRHVLQTASYGSPPPSAFAFAHEGCRDELCPRPYTLLRWLRRVRGGALDSDSAAARMRGVSNTNLVCLA